MSVMRHRARTEDQKLFRRQEILDAAQSHYEDVGYEAFSMANLAKKSSVAKGTLYLYFTTREEVFLALYAQSLVRWSDQFIAGLTPNMDDHAYSARLHNTAMAAEGLFLCLCAWSISLSTMFRFLQSWKQSGSLLNALLPSQKPAPLCWA